MAVSAKVILLVVGVVCAAVAKVDASHAAMEKCMSDNKITKQNLVDFMQTQNDSPDMRCYFKCMMMAHGKMKEDGSYDMDAMKAVQPPALYEIASTRCGDFQTADLCTKAYMHISCLRDNAKEEFAKMMHKEL